jgi:hypothetical protein
VTARMLSSTTSALLFLGDSRSRYMFAHICPILCHPVYCHPSKATCKMSRSIWRKDSVSSAGGMDCNSSMPFSRMGYYVHYGISPSPPYWENPSHFHKDAEYLTSHQLMARAVTDFAAGLHVSTPIVVVFSSFMWDVARHHQFFRHQNSTQWASEYGMNYSLAIQAVERALAPHAHQLVVVADYGCWDTIGSFCARVQRNTTTLLEPYVVQAAKEVKRIADIFSIAFIDLSAAFQDNWHRMLLKQGTSGGVVKYHHPSPSGCKFEWSKLRRWTHVM